MKSASLVILCSLMALALVPPATAHHWSYDTSADNDANFLPGSSCRWTSLGGCQVDHLCLQNAPPQVVDTALSCAGRATTHADETVLAAPRFAWRTLEFHLWAVENDLAMVNVTAGPHLATLNAPLCGTVWSFFCSNPLFVPEHVPIEDPAREYPL